MGVKEWFINPPPKKKVEVPAAVVQPASPPEGDIEVELSPADRVLLENIKQLIQEANNQSQRLDRMEERIERMPLGNGHKNTAEWLNSLGEHTDSPEIAELRAAAKPERTEEERKAWGQKMLAAKEAKRKEREAGNA